MAKTRTVNRGWLRRMVSDGRVRARIGYSYNGRDLVQDSDWLPARFSKGFGDFMQGFMNLTDFDFRSRSGYAMRGEGGIIILHVHSDLSIDVMVTGGK